VSEFKALERKERWDYSVMGTGLAARLVYLHYHAFRLFVNENPLWSLFVFDALILHEVT
jgi:hypothetical protein